MFSKVMRSYKFIEMQKYVALKLFIFKLFLSKV